MSFYPAVEPNPDFARIEEKSLKYWDGEKTFEQSVQMRSAKNADGSNNEFIFYDGPPFANGLPHYGHLLTGFVKDLFARFQTMKGKRVERRFGWDCHGLPAEMGAEKELGISGRQQIAKYGIENFNNHCRTSVMKYASEWEYYVKRQGRWVDFVNDYKTMDSSFMESVMWAFKQLYDKGLMYEAYRVVPYSWAAETPLSNFETQLDNSYRDRADPAATVAFRLEDGRQILAWTTTPWTLPSNLALAVGGKIKYRLINNEFIVGSFAAQKHAKDLLGEKWLPLPKGVKAAVESERLYMRPFEKGDYENFKTLMTDPEITKTLSDGAMEEAKIKSEFERFISDNKKNGYSQWAIFEKSSNQFIGRGGFDERDYVELHGEDEKGPELRLALASAAHGKGYGTELTKALMDYAFYTLKAERVIAGAQTHNPASNKMLSGVGFSNIKTAEYRNAEVNFYLFENNHNLRPDEILGEKLSGLTYTPLFPYFANHQNSFKILIGDFVEEGAGTGIVHMAPGFGEDDQKLCEANGISLLVPVDGAGKYTDEIFDIDGLSLKGRNVLECNADIIKHLKITGNLIKSEQYIHSYPHCWRTDEPLIYKAVPSWYVEVTKFRHRMVELNKGINWIPGHVKEGLFGKWIENARDWSISRNRFWGAPIPVWKSDNPENKQLYVFGSIKELEEFFGTKVTDLHRPYIDNLTKPDPTNPAYTLRRVEDVLDCWFESGSMPYASQWTDIVRHKSGADIKTSDFRFPADFIVEYQAQTRGWFYTLMVLSTALFDKAPFTNCICHGVVLDDKGQKLSKRLNNYADPKWLFDTYGADALRWFMMSSPVMRGAEMYIDKEGKFIRDSVRLYIKPIWNAYSFFTLYANADGVQAEYNFDSVNVLDKYIFGKLRQAVIKVDTALEEYDTIDACNAIAAFFEVLNNWYIRRSRARFWKDDKDTDKLAAYNTLYTALHVMCRVAAPLLPMVTEEIFRGLTGEGGVLIDSLTRADLTLPEGESGVECSPLAGERDLRVGRSPNQIREGIPDFTALARELRKTQTDTESKLWNILRGRNFGNFKFRRQEQIGRYIVDFVCYEKRLIVELDGGQHNEDKNIEYDAIRTRYLESQNFTVIRFWNNEVFTEIESVLEAIWIALMESPFPLTKSADSLTRADLTLPQGESGVECSPLAGERDLRVGRSPNQIREGGISVHLADYPFDVLDKVQMNKTLEQEMDLVRDVCNVAHSIRSSQNIRTRQPLAAISVAGRDINPAFASLILEEVNVKAFKEMPAESLRDFASYKLQLNMKKLGARLGEKFKEVLTASKSGEWKRLENGGIELAGTVISHDEFDLKLEPKDISTCATLSSNDALVVLDTSITPELEKEGIARDLVRMIQQARKDAKLDVSDRIELAVRASDAVIVAFKEHRDYISEQTLTSKVRESSEGSFDYTIENDFDDEKVVISLSRAA